MTLHIHKATVDDVGRIAGIHLAAFDANPLLHVQFPTLSSLKALKGVLALDMRHSIEAGEECGKVVLVVKDKDADDLIISFAKLEFPAKKEDVSDPFSTHTHIQIRGKSVDNQHQSIPMSSISYNTKVSNIMADIDVQQEEQPEMVWPEGCRIDYLDRYQKLADAMKERVIGDEPCYSMLKYIFVVCED